MKLAQNYTIRLAMNPNIHALAVWAVFDDIPMTMERSSDIRLLFTKKEGDLKKKISSWFHDCFSEFLMLLLMACSLCCNQAEEKGKVDHQLISKTYVYVKAFFQK